jgi:hypothetical protein
LDENHLLGVPSPLEGVMPKDLSGLVIGGEIMHLTESGKEISPETGKEILAELICAEEPE